MASFKKQDFLSFAPAIGLLLLSACSDSTILETGGGAGDLDSDAETVALVTPFVGIYDLPDNWSGAPPDEAFLEIQSPDDQGIAIALLHDWDDTSGCIPSRPSDGVVTREPVGNRVFMDNILAFDRSVLTLQGTTLIISFEDINDLDGDNDNSEFISLSAARISVMTVSDLGSSC